jgi:hypothetical protein
VTAAHAELEVPNIALQTLLEFGGLSREHQWPRHILWDVEVKVTVLMTVSQSVSLGVEPHLGLMTRYILLFDNYDLAFVGRPF